MLSADRESKILARVRPLLASIDPEIHLHNVVLDSTRQQLSFIMQKAEDPVVLGMDWLDYVSHRDEDLRERLAAGISERLEAAKRRREREEKD